MGSLNDFQEDSLRRHNELRAIHGVGPLEWLDDLEADARKRAQWCQDNNCMAHGDNDDAGQNLYMSYPAPSGGAAADDWYSGDSPSLSGCIQKRLIMNDNLRDNSGGCSVICFFLAFFACECE